MDLIFSDSRYRNIVTTLLARLRLSDLAAVARVNSAMVAAVRAEIVGRIGPANYDLVSGIDPQTGIATGKNQVTFEELKYFALSVADPTTYYPLVIALRRRLPTSDGHYYIDNEKCTSYEMSDIIAYWLHVGLAGCARLLSKSSMHSDIIPYKGIGENCQYGTQFDMDDVNFVKPVDISQLNQEDLFWFVYYQLVSVSYRDTSPSLRPALDALDNHHFNLIVEIIEASEDEEEYPWRLIRKSNAARARYDPLFVTRTIQQIVVPSDVHVVNDTQVIEGFENNNPVDIFAQQYGQEFEPEMTIVINDGPDVLRKCDLCVRPEMHAHLPYHEQIIDNTFHHLCDCDCHSQCYCGRCQLIIVSRCRRRYCKICECCRCKFYCECPCKCGSICKGTCSCCECYDGCVCVERMEVE